VVAENGADNIKIPKKGWRKSSRPEESIIMILYSISMAYITKSFQTRTNITVVNILSSHPGWSSRKNTWNSEKLAHVI